VTDEPVKPDAIYGAEWEPGILALEHRGDHEHREIALVIERVGNPPRRAVMTSKQALTLIAALSQAIDAP
jgi:hypothetical protein